MDDKELIILFKALGHPIRMKILDLIKDGPKTTGDLISFFPEVSRYAVMKHLNLLESSSLISIRREGRTRLNYLNATPLQYLQERWVSKYQENDARSLHLLKNIVEERAIPMEQEGLVLDSFKIEQEVMINASKEKVFEALTTQIDSWWAYRLCGDSSKLSFQPTIGGSFLETGKDGSGALWGTVTYLKENEEIRLNGVLGMHGAVNSAYTYRLKENGDSTVLYLSHHAAGLLNPEWHQQHAAGWQELLGRFLTQFVEEGKPYTK
ncbi:SRPBCC domain-containing protein [Bacillus sp. 2205SS5-2]|uniref:SRPBCC domain-containing protein n=1 Tax=Bacillus sp. 2205SS5-2 TaxID=3109031 RepID=UPI003005C56A